MSPIAPTGPWTLGTLIWLPLCVVLVVTLALLARLLFRKTNTANDIDRPFVRVLAWACAVLAVALVVGTLAPGGMYPYDSEYHQWRQVSGRVDEVGKRLIGTGDGMAERYVVVIEGQPFGVDDTRASLLQPGDRVELSCKREWQYAATSGWACRWIGATR